MGPAADRVAFDARCGNPCDVSAHGKSDGPRRPEGKGSRRCRALGAGAYCSVVQVDRGDLGRTRAPMERVAEPSATHLCALELPRETLHRGSSGYSMRFYFADSQDMVAPTYDFVHDEYSALRVRQRDDLYAHEVLDDAPYDGMLVSKAIVDGSVKGAGKYSESQ